MIAAARSGIGAVLPDDWRARQLAGIRGLIAASIDGLAIEMVAVAHLTADQGFAVHEAATGTRPGPS